MEEIFVNLTCIKTWFQGGLVQKGFTIYFLACLIFNIYDVSNNSLFMGDIEMLLKFYFLLEDVLSFLVRASIMLDEDVPH